MPEACGVVPGAEEVVAAMPSPPNSVQPEQLMPELLSQVEVGTAKCEGDRHALGVAPPRSPVDYEMVYNYLGAMLLPRSMFLLFLMP